MKQQRGINGGFDKYNQQIDLKTQIDMKNEYLQSLTKDELIQLIEDYSKNWLAMDGVWFNRKQVPLNIPDGTDIFVTFAHQ